MLTQFSTAVGYALRVMQAENAPLAELEQVVSEALAGLKGLREDQSGQWLRMAWFILLLDYNRRERSEYAILLERIRTTTLASKFAEQTEVDEMAQSMAQYVAEQARAEGRGTRPGSRASRCVIDGADGALRGVGGEPRVGGGDGRFRSVKPLAAVGRFGR
jgi:hypothetical protein